MFMFYTGTRGCAIHGRKYRLPANRCKMHLSRATAISTRQRRWSRYESSKTILERPPPILTLSRVSHDYNIRQNFPSLKVESCAPLMRKISQHAFFFVSLSLPIFFFFFSSSFFYERKEIRRCRSVITVRAIR